MKQINILPPSIFNLLSAGEVVENPAAVVKEITENALDAGASSVEISITGGGLQRIAVTDNGSGCDESQIEKVFLPHATSKISKAADLDKIGTLGFRGEALSSIASVSKVTFTSKTAEKQLAVKITLDVGVVTSKTNISANNGTTIEISNLFYNTPARKKFLSSAKVEQNIVTNTVQKLILANPAISFKYIIDNEIVYDYKADNLGKNAENYKTKLKNAVALIYGEHITESLIPVNASLEGLSLNGFISIPSFTKRNRTWQTVMINSRTVEGGTVADAVNDAFSTYMTVGNFPFFVLNLDIEFSSVDVNVHPRKAQVKFSDEAKVYNFAKQAVTEAIDIYNNAKFKLQESKPFEKPHSYLTPDTNAPSVKHMSGGQTVKHISSQKPQMHAVESAPNLIKIIDDGRANKVAESIKQLEKQVGGETQKNNLLKQNEVKNLPESACNNKSINNDKVIQNSNVTQGEILLSSTPVKTLGNIFDTYILFTSDERFYMLDQHAAHERLLYDSLKKQVDEGKVVTQTLLDPVMLMLSPQELNRMISLTPYLNKIGIACESFGNNCFRITELPLAISTRGIDTFLGNILKEVKQTNLDGLSSLIEDKLITECCKTAIKAGRPLTESQIQLFLTQFNNANIKPVCPHGRPIITSFTKEQIEKLFSRR